MTGEAALTVAAVVTAGLALRPTVVRRVDGSPAGGNVERLRRVDALIGTDSSVRRSVVVTRHRRPPRAPATRDVASWCDDIARDLRGGSTLRHALSMVMPGDGASAAATEPMRLALQRARPIHEATATVGHAGADLALALSVITATAHVGGPAAVAIDRVAGTLRQRAADRDERATQAAQARLSAHVMTVVPLLMLALLLASDDDVRQAVTTPVGGACIAAGLTLNGAGWYWMRRIVRSPR